MKNIKFSAEYYEERAVVQKKIARALGKKIQTYLDYENQDGALMDLGAGTGFLSGYLIDLFASKGIASNFKFDLLDVSPHMVQYLNDRFSRLKGVRVIEKSFDDFFDNYSDHYDLIVSSSSLQWSRDLEKLFKKLYQTISPNGLFAFSIILDETFKELRELRSALFADQEQLLLYSHKQIIDMLEANSFEILESSSDQTILYENSAREFFADIKRLGIQGGGSKLTQPQVSELVAAYQNKYSCYIVDDVEVSQNSLDLYPRAAAAVKATYHYGFYIAKKRSS